MFDNLRDSAFYEEEPEDLYQESVEKKSAAAPKRRRKGRFLGMTAKQRFFISMMFMFTVCIMGFLTMFVLGKMSLF